MLDLEEFFRWFSHERPDDLDILAQICPVFVEEHFLSVLEHGQPERHSNLDSLGLACLEGQTVHLPGQYIISIATVSAVLIFVGLLDLAESYRDLWLLLHYTVRGTILGTLRLSQFGRTKITIKSSRLICRPSCIQYALFCFLREILEVKEWIIIFALRIEWLFVHNKSKINYTTTWNAKFNKQLDFV